MTIPAIDVRVILRSSVASAYDDLVTRRTGAAVRDGIERVLADTPRDQPAIIDFSAVRCLDLSCADEIVAKLLLNHGARRFILRGLSESQRDALEPVLSHQHLAVVVEHSSGQLDFLGVPGDSAAAVLEELRWFVGGDGSQPQLA